METYDGGLFWASFVFMAVRVVGSGYYAATYALADKPVHDDIAKLRHPVFGPVGKGALLFLGAAELVVHLCREQRGGACALRRMRVGGVVCTLGGAVHT